MPAIGIVERQVHIDYLFDFFDQDGSGGVDLEELKIAVRNPLLLKQGQGTVAASERIERAKEKDSLALGLTSPSGYSSKPKPLLRKSSSGADSDDGASSFTSSFSSPRGRRGKGPKPGDELVREELLSRLKKQIIKIEMLFKSWDANGDGHADLVLEPVRIAAIA